MRYYYWVVVSYTLRQRKHPEDLIPGEKSITITIFSFLSCLFYILHFRLFSYLLRWGTYLVYLFVCLSVRLFAGLLTKGY